MQGNPDKQALGDALSVEAEKIRNNREDSLVEINKIQQDLLKASIQKAILDVILAYEKNEEPSNEALDTIKEQLAPTIEQPNELVSELQVNRTENRELDGDKRDDKAANVEKSISIADIIVAIKEVSRARGEPALSSYQLSVAIRRVVESFGGNLANLSATELAAAIQKAIEKMREQVVFAKESEVQNQKTVNAENTTLMINDAMYVFNTAEKLIESAMKEAIKNANIADAKGNIDGEKLLNEFEKIADGIQEQSNEYSKDFVKTFTTIREVVEDFHKHQQLELHKDTTHAINEFKPKFDTNHTKDIVNKLMDGGLGVAMIAINKNKIFEVRMASSEAKRQGVATKIELSGATKITSSVHIATMQTKGMAK